MTSVRKKSEIPFVNLHGHSCFSVFDGLGWQHERTGPSGLARQEDGSRGQRV